jgi:hypothetical protein
MRRAVEVFAATVRVVGEVLFLYGLLGWGYGVLVQLTYPDWLPMRLSHLTAWIRLDTFTIMSFILSMVGFFIWRLTKELSK